MICSICKKGETSVVDSRPTEDGTAIRRRRLCVCGARFTTFERVQFREIMVIKKNGRKSAFDRDKLSKSLSGENHPNFGKPRSKKTRDKISGKNHYRYKPIDWYHPNHGKILQKSSSEMVELFPEQNLSRGSLSSVASGVRTHHKGWTALKA